MTWGSGDQTHPIDDERVRLQGGGQTATIHKRGSPPANLTGWPVIRSTITIARSSPSGVDRSTWMNHVSRKSPMNLMCYNVPKRGMVTQFPVGVGVRAWP